MQRALIILGVVLIVLGLLWPVLQKMGWFRLPGDIVVEKENFRLYFPVTTSIIISVILSLIFWLFRKSCSKTKLQQNALDATLLHFIHELRLPVLAQHIGRHFHHDIFGL